MCDATDWVLTRPSRTSRRRCLSTFVSLCGQSLGSTPARCSLSRRAPLFRGDEPVYVMAARHGMGCVEGVSFICLAIFMLHGCSSAFGTLIYDVVCGHEEKRKQHASARVLNSSYILRGSLRRITAQQSMQHHDVELRSVDEVFGNRASQCFFPPVLGMVCDDQHLHVVVLRLYVKSERALSCAASRFCAFFKSCLCKFTKAFSHGRKII